MTACEIIYKIGADHKRYGEVEGVCRITGVQSTGVNFNQWVRDTFTDHASLKSGTIISNEAMFCFDEASEIIQKKTGKEKLQRFRTYSHIVLNGEWFCYTKAHKKQIFNSIINGAEIVCLTDSGQKHLIFKHKIGFWQLDELFVAPDLDLFLSLHSAMTDLMKIGFNQASIIEGNYNPNFIQKNGFQIWREKETYLKEHRGTGMFDFASWMLFLEDSDKDKVKEQLSKKEGKKETKVKEEKKPQLSIF